MVDVGAIIEQLQPMLGHCAKPPEPLEAGITNRNYHVAFARAEVVIRLTGRNTSLLGISREAERLAGARAAELGIGPQVLASGEGFLVTAFLGARTVKPGELDGDPTAIARALRTFHDSAIALPARFWVPDLLDDYARVVADHGGALPDGYEFMRGITRRIAAVLPLDAPVPCHDDLLPDNVLRRGEELFIVDWEYAAIGHRLFDLGNLAVNHEFSEAGEDRLLEAYFDAPPTRARRAALRLMRIMSDAREAAWGVVQGVLSDLDFDYAQYAARHLARLRAAACDSRLEEWLADAATA